MVTVAYDTSGGPSVWDAEPVAPRRVRLHSEQGLRAFHDKLTGDPVVLPWLKDRYGLTDSIIRERQLGVQWRGESMHGNWVLIPVRGEGGDLAQVIERHAPPLPLPDGARKYHAASGWGIHLYPSRPTTSTVVVCSGMFDQMALSLAGLDAVTSTGGCDPRGWPDNWLSLFSGRRVYVVMDRGEEGQADDLARRLGRFARRVKVAHIPRRYPVGTDLVDVRREHGDEWVRELCLGRK